MKYSILFIMMILMFYCEAQKSSLEKTIKEKSVEWQYFNEIGGNEEPTDYIIQSPQEFQKTFAQTQESVDPKEPIPTIDFLKSSVIAIHFGRKSNGGFSVKIKDISTKDNIISVTLIAPKTNPTEPVITVITTPILLVAVPKTTANKVEYKIDYQ